MDSAIIKHLEQLHGPLDGVAAASLANSFGPWECETQNWQLLVAALRGSVESAIALVERCLPGWACGLDIGPKTCIAFVDPHDYADRMFGARHTAEAPTAALALLIALFRARLSRGEQRE